MKKLLRIFLAVIFVFSSAATSKAAFSRADSVLLHYKSGSILLYDTYKNNVQSLYRLQGIIAANRSAILNGSSYLALYGFIPAGEVNDKRAVNTASVQASVVRAYLKTQFGIPHTCVTFDIDTALNRSDVVEVQLVRAPIPAYSNVAINYSESRNLNSIAGAFAQYRNGVPYISYYMVLAKRGEIATDGSQLYAITDGRPVDWAQGDDDQDSEVASAKTLNGLFIKLPDGSYAPAPADAMHTGINLLYVFKDDQYVPATSNDLLAFGPMPLGATDGYDSYQKQGFVRTEPYAESKAGAPARDYPVVGIKTNLAYWAVAMPNAELEFYIGKGFSLGFEGDYAWLSDALGKDKAYYIWGVSAEFRVWLRQNRRFDGLYIGLYGHTGQYDFKFGQIGDQGDYYGGGVTVGYVLPLGKNFNMEFGIGAGYVNFSDTKYKWDGALEKNVFVSKSQKYYIGPTKLRVALLWKF